VASLIYLSLINKKKKKKRKETHKIDIHSSLKTPQIELIKIQSQRIDENPYLPENTNIHALESWLLGQVNNSLQT